MREEEPSGVLLMSDPFLVSDLILTLKNTYEDDQFKELESMLAGCGIDLNESKHLEIIPAEDIEERVKELALEMSGLAVLPWCLKIDTQAVIDSCFYKIKVFGDDMFFHSSFYRPAAVEVSIAVDGAKTGGAMVTG